MGLINAFDLMATLGLDSSKYDKGLDSAKSAGEKLGSGLKTAAKAGLVAVTAATTATVGFGKSAVEAGMNFDQSMSQVAATMGDKADKMVQYNGKTVTSMEALRDFAQEMGRTTAFSATEAADALNYMALAGYDADVSMQMLPNVLNLAAAGSMDLARASDMVTDTQTAFGISLERTSQMVDEMAKAASTGNTSVEQLGDAFLVVGGLTQELNGGMVELADGTKKPVDGVQELEIALTAMANAGIKGGEAGTHMRNMLLKLSDPTDQGVTALENMGVAVFDTEGKMRSLSDVFGDLSKAMDSMTQEQKIQTISDLFNTRDIASAEALLNAVGQDWDKIGAEILNAKGAADKMAKTQLDNLAGDITLFQSALEGAKIAVSDKLTPSLRELVQFGTGGLSRLTDAFQKGGLKRAMNVFGTILSEGLKMIVKKLPSFVDAGVELLSALGNGIINNIDLITDTATQVITKLGDALVKGIPKLMEAGSKILSNILDGIIENLPTITPIIVEYITGIAQIIADNADKLVEVAVVIMGAIGQGLIQAMPIIIEKLPEIFAAFSQAISENPEALILLGPKILGFIFDGIKMSKGVFSLISKFMSSEIISTLGNSLSMGITSIAGTLSSGLVSVAQFATQSMGTALASGGTAAMGMLASALLGGAIAAIAGLELGKKIGSWIFPDDAELYQHYSGITGTFEMLKDFFVAFKDFLGMLWDSIKNKATEMSLNMANSFTDMKNRISSKFEELKSNLTNIFSALAQMALQWGRDLIQQFINGISQKWNDLVNTMSNMSATVRSYIHFSEPDVGPLSDFHTYAPDMMKMFAEGIADNTDLVTNQIEKSFDFGDDVLGSVDANAQTGYGVTGGALSSDSSIMNEVVALLQKIANKELAVSPAGLLTIVKEQNDIYKIANGGVGAI